MVSRANVLKGFGFNPTIGYPRAKCDLVWCHIKLMLAICNGIIDLKFTCKDRLRMVFFYSSFVLCVIQSYFEGTQILLGWEDGSWKIPHQIEFHKFL